MNISSNGSTARVALVAPDALALSINLSGVMDRVSQLLKASRAALIDGVIDEAEARTLAIEAAVLAVEAEALSLSLAKAILPSLQVDLAPTCARLEAVR